MQTTTSVPDSPNTDPRVARAPLVMGVLAAAVALGLLTDGLLRVTPWGVNFLIWTGALSATAWGLARLHPGVSRSLPSLPLLLALLFAAGCVWRDSIILKTADVMAVVFLFALHASRMTGHGLLPRSITQGVLSLIQFAVHIAGGLLLLLPDFPWGALWQRRTLRVALSVLLGIAMALPILALFTGLFASADAVFRQWVVQLLDIDFEVLFLHCFFTGLGAWVVGGYLCSLFLTKGDWRIRAEAPRFLRLGMIETSVVLGSLNLLFLCFLAVQFRHFFGGASQVEVVPGLTYAEYARQGFFELVTIATLLLPILLGMDWLLREQSRRRAFQVLAGVLIILLFVIMGSALQRMRLYVDEYGLTELRLYATAFMLWLAFVFLWFSATVLRRRREPFLPGGLVSGLAALLALHCINPDAMIARTNCQRAAEGKGLDIAYVTSLSADAVPTLLDAVQNLDEELRQEVQASLLTCWQTDEVADWRGMSLSRHRSRQAMDRLVTDTAR